MLKEIEVPHNMIHKWLYYETGYEQLHPNPDIIYWMAEQGYAYNLHWKTYAFTPRNYRFVFPNDEIAALFLMKWS